MSSTANTAKENLSLTQDNVTKVTLEIENFQNDSNQQNTRFKLVDNDKIDLTLFCMPNYRNPNYFGFNYAMIYLHLNNCPETQVTARYRLSILNANGDKCETKGVYKFSKNEGERYGGYLMIPSDYILNEDSGLLVNGKLTIYCEIEEIDHTNHNFPFTNEVNPIVLKQLHSPILDDYQSLLESGKFSDVSLIVKIDEKRLLAHKAILSARSKVFAAMFENDCGEKLQNRVEITDIPVEVCEQMLSYIYTGNIPDLSEFAADLFVAADKYELEHLKAVCETHLTGTLNIDSVANIFLIADMHHATVLKSKCIDYITDNMTKVMATDGWKTLTATRIELTLELLKQMAIKANC